MHAVARRFSAASSVCRLTQDAYAQKKTAAEPRSKAAAIAEVAKMPGASSICAEASCFVAIYDTDVARRDDFAATIRPVTLGAGKPPLHDRAAFERYADIVP